MNSIDIKSYAKSIGADLCGIASVDRFGDAPEGFHPTDILQSTKSVIVIACRVPAGSLDLSKTPSPYYAAEHIALAKISQIVLSMTLTLEDKGFEAIIIPSGPYDYWDAEKMEGKGILSLKHLAEKAGLGFIGRNTLLCNPRYGNLIRLEAIVTDADFNPDKPMDGNLCHDTCRLCEESCPVGAISHGRVNQKKCRSNSMRKNAKGEEIYACNRCRAVCSNRSGIRSLIR
jgi:epoxyqueuosine reductase